MEGSEPSEPPAKRTKLETGKDTVAERVVEIARQRGFAVVEAKLFPDDQERSQLKVNR